MYVSDQNKSQEIEDPFENRANRFNNKGGSTANGSMNLQFTGKKFDQN